MIGKSNKSGGSALKRLKANLKQVGLIGNNAQLVKKKKKANEGGFLEKLKERKRQLNEISSQSMSSNPFEYKFSKPKFEILGKNPKMPKKSKTTSGVVTTGKPGQSRKRSEETRQKTLLVEMKNKNKVSNLVDKRFGENDPTMSVEDKLLQRMLHETRSRHEKGSKFNLEEEDTLTHMGQSLADIDEFDEAGLHSDDEENGTLDASLVKYAHFGGFEEDDKDPNSHKSRNEIMKEIIAKSKQHKYERQKQREENIEMTEQVDAELNDIRALMEPIASVPMEKIETAAPSTQKHAEYDSAVRELTFEKRGRPTNRIKTEEELALEEKKKLEKLENDRLKRMQGLPTSDDEDDDQVSYCKSGGGDDLEDNDYDDIVDEMVAKEEEMPLTYKDGVLVNDKIFMKAPQSGESDDEEDDEDASEEEAESDASDEEDVSDSDEDDSDSQEESSEDEQVSTPKKSLPRSIIDDDATPRPKANLKANLNQQSADVEDGSSVYETALESLGGPQSSPAQIYSDSEPQFDDVLKADFEEVIEEQDSESEEDDDTISNKSEMEELPYSFEAPQSYAEFASFVEGRPARDHKTVVDRLRVLYHPKLGQANKEITENLLFILWEHIYTVADTEIGVSVFQCLKEHLISLGRMYPESFAAFSISKLIKLRDTHVKITKMSLKKVERGFPALAHIMLLYILPEVYSSSDFKHPVMTPATIVIAQILAQAPVKSAIDAASGLFLCEILYSYIHLSKRYIPEMLSFVQNVICAFASEENTPEEIRLPTPAAPLVPTLFVQDWTATPSSLTLKYLTGSMKEDGNDPGFQLALFGESLSLLKRLLRLYNDSISIVDQFSISLPHLKRILEKNDIPQDSTVHTWIQTTQSNLQASVSSTNLKRRPLQLQKRKAVSIPTYAPRFQERYSLEKKHRDPNRERAADGKLRAEHRRELKGAVRELRKDAAFIHRHQVAEKRKADAEYNDKMRKIMGQLAEQEGSMRGVERMTKKGKRK